MCLPSFLASSNLRPFFLPVCSITPPPLFLLCLHTLSLSLSQKTRDTAFPPLSIVPPCSLFHSRPSLRIKICETDSPSVINDTRLSLTRKKKYARKVLHHPVILMTFTIFLISAAALILSLLNISNQSHFVASYCMLLRSRYIFFSVLRISLCLSVFLFLSQIVSSPFFLNRA